jgi:2-enoate reductase
MENTILNVDGLNAANYNMLIEMLELHKVNVLTGAVVENYENGVAHVAQKVGNVPNANGRAASISLSGLKKVMTDIEADHVVVSCGYISNQSLYKEIQADNVYLIGDAERPGNLMTAIWKAYEIAKDI